MLRKYYYLIDHNGYLFLESTKHKNFTSRFKAVEFLNFFYDRLKINPGFTTDERDSASAGIDFAERDAPGSYPYCSPCGKEMNYVKVEKAPVIFHTMDKDRLYFAGDRSLPFSPTLMRYNHEGLFYPLEEKISKRVGLSHGLIRSTVAIQVFQKLLITESSFEWKGKVYEMMEYNGN